jgi:hypothetical protein
MAKTRKSQARAKRAYAKSLRDVKKARKNLDLKMKKHHHVISSMFFPF